MHDFTRDIIIAVLCLALCGIVVIGATNISKGNSTKEEIVITEDPKTVKTPVKEVKAPKTVATPKVTLTPELVVVETPDEYALRLEKDTLEKGSQEEMVQQEDPIVTESDIQRETRVMQDEPVVTPEKEEVRSIVAVTDEEGNVRTPWRGERVRVELVY